MKNNPKKLQVEQLQALSNRLLSIAGFYKPIHNGPFTNAHALLIAEVKVKVDKKLAAGHMPPNGVVIKLTSAQSYAIKQLAAMSLFAKDVDYSNGITRLLALNK